LRKIVPNWNVSALANYIWPSEILHHWNLTYCCFGIQCSVGGEPLCYI